MYGDEHLDTIPAMESNEFIKSSVENIVSILSESEGIPENMCDVPFHDNSPALDISKDQFEDFSDSNDDSTLIDDDSFSIDNIEYVEASPLDSELISSEVMEIFIPKVGGVDEDILLTIKDDILKISSGSTTTRSDISLPDYEAFYNDHVKEISSGSTTTHSDYSLYDSFIFDLSINPFPPADRSDFIMRSSPMNSLTSYLHRIALQYLLSFRNEDTIFDPGISSYHISSFMPEVSHQSETFMKFNVYPKHLNGSPMEILFSTCSPMDQ
nr:hypothetical protein [Tanacetum cinerariifolium]